jgi:GMP synthase (glutamine-hydrolysing)
MSDRNVLLVQVRDPEDPMALHEQECIRRRLVPRRYDMTVRNALGSPADPRWVDGHGAVIIGGSGNFSVHDPRSAEWVRALCGLVAEVLSRNLPGFGLCFGHQLLGHHLGVPVATDPARAEVGTVVVHWSEAAQRDPVFGALGGSARVQTGHSDHVTGIPAEVELFGHNETLTTQAFKVRGSRFYSTQFHPDLTAEEARGRYLAYRGSEGARATDPPADCPSRKFLLGEDDSTQLLGRFLDLV